MAACMKEAHRGRQGKDGACVCVPGWVGGVGGRVGVGGNPGVGGGWGIITKALPLKGGLTPQIPLSPARTTLDNPVRES